MDKSLLNKIGALTAALACAFLIASLFAVNGGQKNTAPFPEKPETIKISEFQINNIMEDAIAREPSLKDDQKSLRETVVRELLDQELLVNEALERELGKRDFTIRSRLIELIKSSIKQKADNQTTDEDLLDYYEIHKNKYMMAAKRSIIHLQSPVTNRINDEDAIKKLDEMFMKAKGQDKDLLDAKSFALTKLRMKYGPTFAKKIFEMEVGVWSDPFQTSTGWHRVLVESEQPKSPRPFENAKLEVKRD
jgi:parvulin-like peptidyl-prolyl isomerase